MRRSAPAAAATLRYTELESSFGLVYAAAGPAGLVRISLGSFEDAFIARLRRDRGVEVRRDDRALSRVRRTLRAYLDGRTRSVDLEADLAGLPAFHRHVFETLRRLPYGQVISYGDLARRAGKPRAARAVGQAMSANPLPLIIPCHRVIAGDGTLGGYGGSLGMKRALLALEGIPVPRDSRPARARTPDPYSPTAARTATRRARSSSRRF